MENLLAYFAIMHFFMLPVGSVYEGRECWKDIGGYYDTDSVFARTAYICDGIGDEPTLYAKYHETGHYIYHNRLSQEQIKEWGELHKGKEFVTPYSRTNADEDFAESYAVLMRDGKLPKSLRAKERFLRKL